MSKSAYHGNRFPPAVIQLAVWMYGRFTLSLRDVEELLAERDFSDAIVAGLPGLFYLAHQPIVPHPSGVNPSSRIDCGPT